MAANIDPAYLQEVAQLIKKETNGAAIGSGIVKLLADTKKKFNGNIPEKLLEATALIQPASFGGTPTPSKDIAPCVIFIVVFLVLLVGNSYIFVKDMMRGHKFLLTLLLIAYYIFNIIGMALRWTWANDNLKIRHGLASGSLIDLAMVWIAGINLILAQRIFTWRHPKFCTSRFFKFNIIFIYSVIFFDIIFSLVVFNIPFLYYMSDSSLKKVQKMQETAKIITCLYPFSAGTFILQAFMVKPNGNPDVCVAQPYWIESFDFFYYVPRGAAKQAREAFINKSRRHKRAIRTIASSLHHYEVVEELQRVPTYDRPTILNQNYSIWVVTVTTLLLLISTCTRCAATFIHKPVYEDRPIFRPVVFWTCKVTTETLVCIIYMIFRIDLRFYKPDRLPKYIREAPEAKPADNVSEERLLEKPEFSHVEDL